MKTNLQIEPQPNEKGFQVHIPPRGQSPSSHKWGRLQLPGRPSHDSYSSRELSMPASCVKFLLCFLNFLSQKLCPKAFMEQNKGNYFCIVYFGYTHSDGVRVTILAKQRKSEFGFPHRTCLGQAKSEARWWTQHTQLGPVLPDPTQVLHGGPTRSENVQEWKEGSCIYHMV